MNFLEKISEIKGKLTSAEYPNLVHEIPELQISGGTGGEVLISVCSKLIEIKYTTPAAFMIIEYESNNLIDYCKSLGSYPKWMGLD